jgi:hypothetical protein
MKNFLFVFVTAACFPAALTAQEKINPTDPQPTCAMCPGTLVPLAEIEAYAKKAIAEKLVDQQVRDIDIGKAHIGVGMVYRGKLDKPAPDAPIAKLTNVERPQPHHLYWPALDVDLAVESIRHPDKFPLVARSGI